MTIYTVRLHATRIGASQDSFEKTIIRLQDGLISHRIEGFHN